jgi:hypothetical protein
MRRLGAISDKTGFAQAQELGVSCKKDGSIAAVVACKLSEFVKDRGFFFFRSLLVASSDNLRADFKSV